MIGGDGGAGAGAGSSAAGSDAGSQGAAGADFDGIFASYLDACDAAEVDEETDAHFARGLLRVREYLAAGDATSCLICLGAIKPTEAVWSCGGCFTLLHLGCTQQWARNQAAAGQWSCPKCRRGHAEVPAGYACFCGRVQEPEYDPWLAPHSCGELCGKALSGGCGHGCLLLCHAGPCPPCPAIVDAPCFCGKLALKKRCGRNEFSCGVTCGKRLPCGHACPDVCHPGPCAPCEVVLPDAPCACGAERARRRCAEAAWRCARPCGRPLACGRHRCQQGCHSRPEGSSAACGPCPTAGSRTCHCGAVPHPELACDEPAPSCGGTCGRLLPCGAHACAERCHAGPCSATCRERVEKECRCGRTRSLVLCTEEAPKCGSKCAKLLACGRHACKRRCCDGLSCLPCEEVCGRWLRCKNHKCEAPCHAGPCRPCPLTSAVRCACGGTSYTLPCGAEASALPPRCAKPCALLRAPATCRHALRPHRCHFGPCRPACPEPCGATLAGCGHVCGSRSCHDAPLPAVALFEPPKPPQTQAQLAAAGKRAMAAAAEAAARPPAALEAAAAAAALAGADGRGGWRPCPPCEVPVERRCIGGHGTRQLPCHSSAVPFGCGAPCGRPLPCARHACAEPCGHYAPAGERCEAACARRCELPRACGHPCARGRCHEGVCPPCEERDSCSCSCGKTLLAFPCYRYHELLSAEAAGAGGSSSDGGGGDGDPLCCGKPCNKELPACAHPCRRLCHRGACDARGDCEEEVSVRCACRRLKEKWRCARVQQALAAAGQQPQPGVAPKLLACDEGCAAAAAAAAASKAQAQPAPPSLPPNKAEEQPPQPPQQPLPQQQQQPARRLTRAEREALAAQREEQRRLEARRALLLRVAAVAGAVVALALVLMVVLDGALALLERADRALQQRYRPDEL